MAEIYTRKGVAILVGDEDFAMASSYTWMIGAGGSGYAARNKLLSDDPEEGGTILLHRQLMGLKRGDKTVVDHINGNTLDNRRANLRLCTRKENTRNQKRRSTNTSGYKGVSFHKGVGKWCATIRFEGKQHTIGWFLTPEEAHACYCEAATKYHGEFANMGVACP